MSDKFCVGSEWKSNISLKIVWIHVKRSLNVFFLIFPLTATFIFPPSATCYFSLKLSFMSFFYICLSLDQVRLTAKQFLIETNLNI